MSDVTITLDGKEAVLKCTPRAFKTVNALGGFTEAFRLLAAFDATAYTIIVAAGLNKKPGDVEDAVYRTGLPDLTEGLSDYVALLANGGKRREPQEEAEPGEA